MDNKPLTLPEIHAESLKILQKIMAICEELQIDYHIAYGTLIGVVRHKGFIPWDDDLDIIMLRPDYEKFKDYCTKNEKTLHPFKLMGRHNTKGYPFAIARFCDLRYRMVAGKNPDAGMGMFIDIYPLDGAGSDAQQVIKQVSRKKLFWTNCLYCALRDKFEPSTKGFLRTLVKIPGYFYAKFRGADYFLDKLESLKDLYTLEESRYVTCMIWDWPVRLEEKSWYEKTLLMEFEGIQVKVPVGYEQVLKTYYGDYMQLPPEESRVPHHDYELYRRPEYFQ